MIHFCVMPWQINEGEGTVKLKREHIAQTFPNINDLEGNFIFAAVSVLTESGKKKTLFNL